MLAASEATSKKKPATGERKKRKRKPKAETEEFFGASEPVQSPELADQPLDDAAEPLAQQSEAQSLDTSGPIPHQSQVADVPAKTRKKQPERALTLDEIEAEERAEIVRLLNEAEGITPAQRQVMLDDLDKEKAEWQDFIEALTPSQREELVKDAQEGMKTDPSQELLEAAAGDYLSQINMAKYQDRLREAILNHKVTYQGRKVPMLKLMEKVAKEEKTLAVGGYEPGVRGKHEEGHLMGELLPEERHPGAHKMNLSPEEEEMLGLDLFGRGVDIVPEKVLGLWTRGERQYSFGIYGRQSNARVLMRDRWAGKDPELVLNDQDFYDDLMEQAAGMELTVMAHPVKDLPLEPLLDNMFQRLTMNMALRAPQLAIEDSEPQEGKAPLTEEQKQQLNAQHEAQLQEEAGRALDDLARDFAPERLRRLGMVDEKNRVKAGSHWIFTWGPFGELVGEGITHHQMRDRKTVSLGIWEHPHLTHAVFDTFLGRVPVDAAGKRLAGQGVLYVANGFRFEDRPDNERLFYEGRDGEPDILPEAVLPEARLWYMSKDFGDEPMPRLLLNTARSRAVGYSAVAEPAAGFASRIGSLFGRLRRR